MLSYLFDIYQLKDHQQQFQLVEEIEGALLGSKYSGDKSVQDSVETNQNVGPPSIDKKIKLNIKQESVGQQKNGNATAGNVKQNLNEQSQTINKDVTEFDISDSE